MIERTPVLEHMFQDGGPITIIHPVQTKILYKMPPKRTSEKPADKKGGKNQNSNMLKSAEHSYSDNSRV